MELISMIVRSTWYQGGSNLVWKSQLMSVLNPFSSVPRSNFRFVNLSLFLGHPPSSLIWDTFTIKSFMWIRVLWYVFIKLWEFRGAPLRSFVLKWSIVRPVWARGPALCRAKSSRKTPPHFYMPSLGGPGRRRLKLGLECPIPPVRLA